MISIILQISSFDNLSHDDEPSRISHNSIISWQDYYSLARILLNCVKFEMVYHRVIHYQMMIFVR